jgi:hypothetical protein
MVILRALEKWKGSRRRLFFRFFVMLSPESSPVPNFPVVQLHYYSGGYNSQWHPGKHAVVLSEAWRNE